MSDDRLKVDAEALYAQLRDSLRAALVTDVGAGAQQDAASAGAQVQAGMHDALAGVVASPVGAAVDEAVTPAAPGDASGVAMIGIHSGGAWLAERLHHDLQLTGPLGFLSSSFYRDDVGTRGFSGGLHATRIDFEVTGRHIVLVDDILHTGRTTRAALNEIFDYGRPASVQLAVLIDRGGRELPFHPNHVGAVITLRPGERFVLSQQTSGVFELRVEGN